MTTGDLIVGAIIAILIIGALAWIWHDRKKGKKCFGCNCSQCPETPNLVRIDEEETCECCKKK
jgi:hypothetical protein